MSEPLRFAYVCERDFLDLPGSDAVRHCDQCRLDVINYDLLDLEAREAILRRAATERVCLFATAGPTNLQPCNSRASKPVPPPVRTGGLPRVPEKYIPPKPEPPAPLRPWWRRWRS